MRNNNENTKDQIVAEATKLFAEVGIHKVSFQMIASKVGISQPALYKHFSDKEDLLKVCVIAAAVNGRKLIDNNVDQYSAASDQIRSYIEGNFMWAEQSPQDAEVVFSIYYFSHHSDPIREILTNINKQSVARLGIRITAGQREGLWTDVNVTESARLIHDLVVTEIFKALHSRNEMTLEERTNMVWKASQKILKG